MDLLLAIQIPKLFKNTTNLPEVYNVPNAKPILCAPRFEHSLHVLLTNVQWTNYLLRRSRDLYVSLMAQTHLFAQLSTRRSAHRLPVLVFFPNVLKISQRRRRRRSRGKLPAKRPDSLEFSGLRGQGGFAQGNQT